jgi:hypothetical protein
MRIFIAVFRAVNVVPIGVEQNGQNAEFGKIAKICQDIVKFLNKMFHKSFT